MSSGRPRSSPICCSKPTGSACRSAFPRRRRRIRRSGCARRPSAASSSRSSGRGSRRRTSPRWRGILADAGLNIDRIDRLSARVPLELDEQTPPRVCVEFSASAPAADSPIDEDLVRTRLTALTAPGTIDVAFQHESIFRRNRRLVAFDMDSTLIQGEVIDELARLAGTGDQVRAITEAAMRGELDFQESFRRRVRPAERIAGVGAGARDRGDSARRRRRAAHRRCCASSATARRSSPAASPSSAASSRSASASIGSTPTRSTSRRRRHRRGRAADRRRRAQGRAAAGDRAERGTEPRTVHRRRRRRQRSPDAAARRAGHRLPRQAGGPVGRAAVDLVAGARRDPVSDWRQGQGGAPAGSGVPGFRGFRRFGASPEPER